MRVSLIAFCLSLGLSAAGPARAEGERAGDFDYYILSLGWSPSWCALEGDARGDRQCDAGRGFGFTLHGLWPQYEEGWPSYCRSVVREATRAETAAMVDIMGSAGLAWHEWKKHGRCSGLSAGDYFALSREAYRAVTIPAALRDLARDIRLPASVVEEAFIEANPGLAPGMITVTCEDDRIDEVRLCLDPDLGFRACAPNAARDCRLKDALMDSVR
ncbi:ribonuclease T2 [Frigidibacter sp. RF13]|uniref:ribonuclease T2 n=1 Tax=Frigidibacter sp. RF13 TaxID=2997340 RepID=UPI002271FE4D|nr:ribonuclease T2 [Frigidibacter sp. RF13]MCY1126599.1 ribonuclease T2 [Frigidibacter sp. RF13]